jgi:hypothetical protein
VYSINGIVDLSLRENLTGLLLSQLLMSQSIKWDYEMRKKWKWSRPILRHYSSIYLAGWKKPTRISSI